MTEQYELIFLKKLQDCIVDLDELDEIINELPEKQRLVDSELSDWYHFLQNEENLSDETYANVAKKIAKLRKIRWSYKKTFELVKRYKDLSSRMMTSANRGTIKSEIVKVMNSFDEPYKNRIITEDDIAFVKAKEETKKVRKARDKKLSNDEVDKQLLELKKQGLTQREMSEIVGIKQASISVRFKKMKERNKSE